MMTKTTHIIIYILSAVLCFCATACSDDESFTTDAGAKLGFSTDTVAFDTIFCGISSSTERFNVFNRNDKAVKLSSVKLESGGASGFRMNVDGQYGTELKDIDILKKDSIFVFVEVTCKDQPTDSPTRVLDAIVFTLQSGVQQKVILEAWGQNIRVIKAATLHGENKIDSKIPVVVYDSLVVAEDAKLDIEAGTRMCFHQNANLVVRGDLNVNGTKEKPVVFRGDRTDNILKDLPYDRLDCQWGGIEICPSSKVCNIEYADIHSGSYGIICNNIKESINIKNTIIHNVGGDALRLTDSKALVANCQLSNAFGNCVGIYGGSSDFYHCTMAQFYPWDVRESAIYVSNKLEESTFLVEHAYFMNCFVTGYADDEVYGDPGDNELNLRFYNCVLMTDVSDTQYFIDCTEEKKDNEKFKDTNFRVFDTKNYIYDFHLDSLSTARGKGSIEYAKLYPTDMDGTERGSTPDAGCYQWK